MGGHALDDRRFQDRSVDLRLAAASRARYANPRLGPALPIEERVDLREKFRLLRNAIVPILPVLGVIFFRRRDVGR